MWSASSGALRLLTALALLSCSLAASSASGNSDIFQSTNLLRISIQISEEGIRALRRSQPATRPFQERPKVQATVIEGGRRYTNVLVQLKGFSSFQPIDGKPGLTLNFAKMAPQQRFHGLTKISLNNSVQDRTRLHEKLARELFAAASVPVPRSDFAAVRLNGRDLGFYVMTEGFDEEFLKRHFKRADGNLYDGGVLTDVDRPLALNSGQNPEDHRALHRLVRAARLPDAEERYDALKEALDLERFLSMTAMEMLLCHSDSYSMNRNNYRVYHDPLTDKMVFMPHGMDRILGTHRSPLDLPLVPPLWGLVARAVLTTPEGRRRYIEKAGVLFTNYFQAEKLCHRVRELDARLEREWGERSRDHAEQLCDRIQARVRDLQMQFLRAADFAALPAMPDFELFQTERISGWYLRPKPGQPLAELECRNEDAGTRLLIRSPGEPVNVSLRTRLLLAPGSYRLSGDIKPLESAENSPANATRVMLSLSRGVGSRFVIETQRFDARRSHLTFEIHPSRSLEEIEMICDVRSPKSQVILDPSGLSLTKADWK
ncbi:MAG: CotH kinase family protein [Verrucomicrobiota bacterium]